MGFSLHGFVLGIIQQVRLHWQDGFWERIHPAQERSRVVLKNLHAFETAKFCDVALMKDLSESATSIEGGETDQAIFLAGTNSLR